MTLVPSQLLLEGRAFQRYGAYSDISGYGSHFASVMFACVRAFSLMTRIPQALVDGKISRALLEVWIWWDQVGAYVFTSLLINRLID